MALDENIDAGLEQNAESGCLMMMWTCRVSSRRGQAGKHWLNLHVIEIIVDISATEMTFV